jgi:hypothetical protein
MRSVPVLDDVCVCVCVCLCVVVHSYYACADLKPTCVHAAMLYAFRLLYAVVPLLLSIGKLTLNSADGSDGW